MKFWIKALRSVPPLRWAIEVNDRLDLLESQLKLHQSQLSRLELGLQQLNGIERAIASTRGDVAALANRLARFEQLVGISETDQGQSTATALSQILDVRLTNLECRLLTYLEGPYLNRIATTAPGGLEHAHAGD